MLRVISHLDALCSQRIIRPRTVINVLVFHGFIMFTHYMREMGDRRMYTMRAELKTQFKAKQRAQISERKT